MLQGKNLSIYLFVVFLSFGCTQEHSEHTPEKFLFLGNSITYGGRYVDYIETAFILQEQGHELGVLDLGLSSETISCLSEEDHPFPRPCVLNRLSACLDATQPDQVVACYGINCGIYHPRDSGRFAAYQKGIRQLIQQCREREIALTLLTPPPFAATLRDSFPTPDSLGYSYRRPFPQYDAVMRSYADWILTLDDEAGVEVVDIRSPLLEFINQSYTAKDIIHPTPTGHALIAESILDAWNRPVFPQILNNGLDLTENDSIWQVIEMQVRQQRESYDRAQLNHIGHGHPGIGKKEFPLGKAQADFDRSEREIQRILKEAFQSSK